MSTKQGVEARWEALVGFYRKASSEVSTIIRQATFAAFAFVWLLKSGKDDGIWDVPLSLALGTTCLVISVICDLAQYVLTAFFSDRALNAGESPELPQRSLQAMHFFWWLKLILALAGFVLVFRTAASRIHIN